MPGQMFPAGGSPGPPCAPSSLITPGPSSSSPQTLPPRPAALLPYQPALLAAAWPRRCPDPSSCTESPLGAAFCVSPGSQEPQQGEAPSPAPGEGQRQALAHVASCPTGAQPWRGDHAAALQHRISCRSARSSLGAGAASPLLAKDPSLADAQQKDAKRLRTLGSSSLAKRGLRGDHIALHSFLSRGSGEGGADLAGTPATGSVERSKAVAEETFLYCEGGQTL